MASGLEQARHALRTVSIEIEEAALARAEAHAAARRTSVPALIEAHLRDLGDGLVAARLPDGAKPDTLRMFSQGGRDTTARFLADGAWDEFEQPMPAHVFAWARSHPGLFIDGGANSGFYALLVACASERSRVLAFEPDPVVRALLQANVDANGLQPRVVVRAEALSDAPGRRPFYVPPQDHGMIETSGSLDPTFKARFSEVLDVAATTVDAAVAGAGADAQAVTMLKLDLAGHEAAALAGAERTVGEHRPVVFAEVLDRADFGALSRFVGRHNYMDVPLASDGRLFPRVAVGFERNAWNHAFVPAEALPAFLVAWRTGA